MSASAPFHRDRATWTGYGLLGIWAAFLYFIGPAASAIGEDLGLTDAQRGSIGTALAAGAIGSALLGPSLVRHRGRRGGLLLVLPSLALAASLLATGAGYLVVMAAVACIGLLGAVVANTATAILSEHQPRYAARAITEANAVASWLGVASPALLGFALAAPTGWRGAAVALGVLPLAMLLRVRVLASDRPSRTVAGPATGARAVPGAFWPALVVVGAAVALEFSIGFWTAPFIQERTGASLAAAATALSALTLGMALARTFAAPLANLYPLPALIAGCFLLAVAGLAALLLATSYLWCLAALLLSGTGLSLLFPYAQSFAVGLMAHAVDRAVAFTAVAIGLSLGLGPFLLGVLAGRIGLAGALSAGFAIAAVGLVAIGVAARLRHRGGEASPPTAPAGQAVDGGP